MIKVVHITSNISGGAGVAALRIHHSLLEEGVESTILQKVTSSDQLNIDQIYTLNEKSDFFYRLKRKLNLTSEKKQSKLIATYAKDYEYEIATFPETSYNIEDHPLVKNADIVHLHWVAGFLNYPSFFKKIKKPIVWTLHDMNPFMGVFHYQGDAERNKKQYGFLENKILQDKKKYIHQTPNIHIVTPSEWLGNLSATSSTLSNYPHECIAYGIYFNKSNPTDILEFSNTLNLNKDYKTLLFIAHGVEIYRKGFDLLVNAIKMLSNRKFNLISVGGDKIEVDSMINHTHFKRINDAKIINQLYQIADITVLPSREDNLPNVMLESLSNGTPIISFSNGGMKEHIKTGENGILVDEIGVTPLKNAIEDFLTNKYTFSREKIQQYAKEQFDQKRQAQKYIELYRKILDK